MSMVIDMKKVLMALLLTGLAACASKPTTEDGSKVEGLPDAAAEAKDIQVIGGGQSGTGIDGANGMAPTRSEIAESSPQNVVYFDYDSATVKEEYKPLLQKHANFLLANPNVKVAVEGHADERGTREYNLALGENRAHKIKQFMTLQGVQPDQVATASYGEERPAVDEHTEDAWAKNRRAVFVYGPN